MNKKTYFFMLNELHLFTYERLVQATELYVMIRISMHIGLLLCGDKNSTNVHEICITFIRCVHSNLRFDH